MTIAVSAHQQNSPFAEGFPLNRIHPPPSHEPEGHRKYRRVDAILSTTADPINRPAARAVSFGPFSVLPAQRLLRHAGEPIRVGSRAFDILIALLDRPGELVTKNELISRAWPNTHVDEGNLKVQVALLRRVLRDGRGGERYLATDPGRGYRFVAPVTFAGDLHPSAPGAAEATKRGFNLPTRLTQPVGRADIINKLAERLPQYRLLTVAGPGGIGKTTVALAVAEQLINAYEHGVWLIDLAPLSDPELVPSAVMTALGFVAHSGEPLLELISRLRDKRMLLVLDNCEHVIASAEGLVAAVLRGAPNVQILATSREPLRAAGEHLYRLPPLASPPASAGVIAREALSFPAVQLFVERTASTLGEFELSDAGAPLIATICRNLDGIPLAIELAAARVGAFGLQGVAARMEDCFRLLTVGYRTAPPRHQTMYATFEWSYRLLSDCEQSVLRRLSTFAATSFTLGATATLAADTDRSESEILDTVLELVAKSLVVADVQGAEPRLRLLETTRAYARTKLAENAECDTLYYRQSA